MYRGYARAACQNQRKYCVIYASLNAVNILYVNLKPLLLSNMMQLYVNHHNNF